MRILENIFILVLPLIFFLYTAPSTAEIKYAKIRSDDSTRIHFDQFGFTNTGCVSVAISSVSITSKRVTSNISRPDPSRLGFYLLSDDARFDFSYELRHNPNLCELDSKFISLLFNFQHLSPPPHSSLNKTYNVTYPEEYSLSFANCNPLTQVTMDVRTELYNIDDVTTRDYLSAGLTQLPSIYFYLSLTYVCFLGLWICKCFMKRRSFSKIHVLMGVLLVVKALNLMYMAEDKQYMKVTGSLPGRDVSFYIFKVFYNVIVFFTVGLCFMQSFSQEEERYSPYKHFCSVVSVYSMIWVLFFSGIMDGIDDYKYFVAKEIFSLVFYMIMFYMFLPFEGNQYFFLKDDQDRKVKDEDKNAVEIDAGDYGGV